MVSVCTSLSRKEKRGGGRLDTYLSECICEIQRLEEGVEIASGALVLKSDETRFLLRVVIVEIVP